jgi:hypothetical protein
MPLITLFSAPKPFTHPHIAMIQRNAVNSWLALGGEVEVFLVGDEAGIGQAAMECGAGWLPEVRRNQAGTPLVSSIFDLARRAGRAPLLAYLNADVMLLPDFIVAARQVSVQVERFLLIGQRWDLDVRMALDFGPGWEARLRSDLQARGRLHQPAGSDYFLFPAAIFTETPDFAIGRAGWDNWMIYQARRQGWAVVDGTPSVAVIHQDHDYAHLPGGRPHYEMPESFANQEMAGGAANLYMVLDADWQLRRGRVRRPTLSYARLLRRIEVWLTPPDGERRGLWWALARKFRRLRRKMKKVS